MIVGSFEITFEGTLATGTYTLLVYKQTSPSGGSLGRKVLIDTQEGLTLSAAWNSARDSLAALAAGSEKHLRVTGQTQIADPVSTL